MKHSLKAFIITALMAALVFALQPHCRAGMLDVGDNDEIKMGEEIAKEVIDAYGLVDNEAEKERLLHVGAALSQASGRPELEYHFNILNTDMVNAFALPGGYIFVTRGMMDFVDDDDELAAVVSHELVHIALKHGVVMYKKSMKAMMMNLLILLLTQDPNLVIANEMYQQGRSEIYGRRAELDSDAVGMRYMYEAGYDARAQVTLMEKLGRIEMHQAPIFEGYFDVHPPTKERVGIIRDSLKKLGIDSQNTTSYKIRARTFAREICNAGSCAGALMGGEREILRFSVPDQAKTPYERAVDVSLAVNKLLDKGVEIYDVSVVNTGGGAEIRAGKDLIARVLKSDAEADGKPPAEIAALWAANIKSFLWTDLIKDDF